jgi:hypothetical protein
MAMLLVNYEMLICRTLNHARVSPRTFRAVLPSMAASLLYAMSGPSWAIIDRSALSVGLASWVAIAAMLATY